MRFLILFLLISPSAFAEVFKNSYINFMLPNKFKCVSSKTEWICQNTDSAKSKEAIIILTAKQVGPMDSLEQYIKYLDQPKRIPGATGTSQIRVKPKRVQIGSHTWVDSLHFASELPNFFTRYLSTTKQNLAILVTLSAHRSKYQEYSLSFSNLVNSMKVTSNNNLLNSPGELPNIGGSSGTGTLGGSISNTLAEGDLVLDEEIPKPAGGEKSNRAFYVLVLCIVLIVGYYIVSKKKK